MSGFLIGGPLLFIVIIYFLLNGRNIDGSYKESAFLGFDLARFTDEVYEKIKEAELSEGKSQIEIDNVFNKTDYTIIKAYPEDAAAKSVELSAYFIYALNLYYDKKYIDTIYECLRKVDLFNDVYPCERNTFENYIDSLINEHRKTALKIAYEDGNGRLFSDIKEINSKFKKSLFGSATYKRCMQAYREAGIKAIKEIAIEEKKYEELKKDIEWYENEISNINMPIVDTCRVNVFDRLLAEIS